MVLDDDTRLEAIEAHGSPLEDELVLLDGRRGEFVGLNAVGRVVWETLRGSPQTLGELVLEVQRRFDGAEECRRDLVAFLEDLHGRGLVKIVDGSDV